jgi:hypothetical protein
VAAIETLLCEAPAAAGRVVVREPSLIRVAGRSATARHYVLEFVREGERGPRLAELRHGRWTFHRIGDQWSVVDRSELAAGDARVPEFLAAGLALDFACARVPAGDDSALQRVADADAVRVVLTAYGLSADAGDADLVGSLYTEDAIVEIGGDRIYRGRKPMADMINGGFHQSLLPWAGHTMGPGLVAVEGDRAVSLHIARTYGPPPRSAADLSTWNRHPFRFSVNRWVLTRIDDGWQISERISHPVPGSQWRAVLSDGLESWRAVPRIAARGGEDLDYLERRYALDIVTAAAFRLSAADGTQRWPFADDALLDVDGCRVPAHGTALAEALRVTNSCVGVVPAAGSVGVEGSSTIVGDVLLTYSDDGSGRMGPASLHMCRWDLVRDGASWLVLGATLRR